jgi:lysophospholipase L1-like esterase
MVGRPSVPPPRYVFCGESSTAGGRNWGFRLEGNLLNSMNLAGNGYTASQIFNQVSIALNYKPDYVFIMAGTNDVLQKDFSPSNTIKEYENIIQAFKGTKTIPVFTLIPLTSSKDVNINKHIKILNSQLDSLLKSQGITTIDLNPYLAPSGYLSKEYTTDGVHLSEAGYKIWVREVKKNNFISTQ